MAKSEINKSQAIREALRAHRGKTPTQIADILKEQGVHVTSAYVSNVKFHTAHRGKRRKVAVSGAARRTRGPGASGNNSLGNLGAALDFVRAAGGLDAAKAALATIDEIGQVVR